MKYLLLLPFFAANFFAGPAAFLITYCNDCHGAEKQKGDRRFDQLALPVAKVDTLIEIKEGATAA